MGKIKQINIKNRTYYLYDDMINIKDFAKILLKFAKTRQKVVQKHCYLLYWIYHEKKQI